MTETSRALAGHQSLPRRLMETQGFSLGDPRSVVVSRDGRRVFFLRARSGTDPRQSLRLHEVETERERVITDALPIDAGELDPTPEEELMRRERSREQARGIVAHSIAGAVRG